jgi:hypothetical protein
MDWTQNINKYKYKEYFYFLTEENVNIKIVLPFFYFILLANCAFLYFGFVNFSRAFFCLFSLSRYGLKEQ